MPHLSVSMHGEGERADGKKFGIPPLVVMGQFGPCVQVAVTVSDTVARPIIEGGGELPPPESGRALIDTGASVTCIDQSAADKLNLPVIDVGKMTSASHAAVDCNVYPVKFEIQGFVSVNANRAMGAELKSQGLIALIGRDLLQHCTLYYNGANGQFTLSI